MANIKEFVASFTNNGVNLAHANRFSIEGGATPGGWKGNSNLPLNQLIRDVNIGGKSLNTYVYRNIGTPVKMPYDIMNNEIALTFMDTEFRDIYRFYTEWMREVYNDDDKEVGFGFYNDYTRDLHVFQHSKSITNPTYGVKYFNCYPIIISDIAMSNESTNTWSTFTVTLVYETSIELVPKFK